MATVGVSLIGPGWGELRNMLQRMDPIDPRRALRETGQFLLVKVRKGVLSGKPGGQRLRANAPATVRRKGFNKPLIDTGQMVSEIGLRERRSGGFAAVFVGIDRSKIHVADPRRRVARIARFHEFGTAAARPRPFFGPVLEENEIRNLFSDTLGSDLGLIGPVKT